MSGQRISVSYDGKRIRTPTSNAELNVATMSEPSTLQKTRIPLLEPRWDEIREVSSPLSLSRTSLTNGPPYPNHDLFEFFEPQVSDIESSPEPQNRNNPLVHDIVDQYPSNNPVSLPFSEQSVLSPLSDIVEPSLSVYSRSNSPLKLLGTNVSENILVGLIIGAYEAPKPLNLSVEHILQRLPSGETSIYSGKQIDGTRKLSVDHLQQDSTLGQSNLHKPTLSSQKPATPVSAITPHKYLPLQGTIKDRPVLMFEKPPMHISDGPPGIFLHTRNGLSSSTTSNASTVTAPKDRRFVQYVINKQTSLTTWLMESVIRWLEVHGFNKLWKETFKRNEISGNRFLELCNYDADLMIWKQFTKYLQVDESLNNVHRFICLLKEETEGNMQLPSDDIVGSRKSLNELAHSYNPSSESTFHNNLLSPSGMAENRKLMVTLAGIPHGNSMLLPTYSGKQRPFSYVGPLSSSNNSKASTTPKQKDSYKFFRKQNRTSSEERNSVSTPNSAVTPKSQDFPKKSTKTLILLNEDLIRAQQVQQHQQQQQPQINTSNSSQGSKKDRFMSTFRRVDRRSKILASSGLPNSSQNAKDLGSPKLYATTGSHQRMPSTLSLSSVGLSGSNDSLGEHSVYLLPLNKSEVGRSVSDFEAKKEEDIVSLGAASEEFSLLEASQDHTIKKVNQFEEPHIRVLDYSSPLGSRQPLGGTVRSDLEQVAPVIEQKYLPKICMKGKVTSISRLKTILLSKDNQNFTPFDVDLDCPTILSQQFTKFLGLIEIGRITVHLTDFGHEEGQALPEANLLSIIEMIPLPKFYVHQELSSPSINTYLTTSLDLKLFEIKGDGNEKTYPATPQYLLEGHQEAKVDYWNFKDAERLPKINPPKKKPLSLSLSVQTKDSAKTPKESNFTQPKSTTSLSGSSGPNFRYDNLQIPAHKNLQRGGNQPPVRQPLLQIDTSVAGESLSKPSLSESPSTSFRVLRKESNEIDFDKRKKSPYELKAPKHIANIYSSSVGSAKLPILATTVATLRDDLRDSKSPIKPDECEKSEPPSKTPSIIARRKPPPPPVHRNGSVLSKKSTMLLLVSSVSDDSNVLRSNSGGSLRRGLSKYFKRRDPFKQNEISFENISVESDQADEDEFFVKKINKADSGKKSIDTGVNDSNDGGNDGDDDFFMKPIKNSRNVSIETTKSDKSIQNAALKMAVRPPVEEVYQNLEMYFPNTNLDKPIIDDSPILPVVSKKTEELPKKPSISRTFSNANRLPQKTTFEEAFDVGAPLKRRMKTIRIVANEARQKRLELQQKNLPQLSRNSSSKTGEHNEVVSRERSPSDLSETKATASPNAPVTRTPTGGGLMRRNTKMWGQRVIEVTSKEIDKGFVSKIRNNKNGQFEEFAWIKGELIGRGSFGAVYIALNVTTGEMLAVKQVVVPFGAQSHKTKDGIDALHKEVETMKDLDHVNIVQYLGFEQKNNTYSLFLEYVAGGLIAICMKNYGPFEEELVQFITRQVLQGLQYLHENGILHRDLKADNLLLEVDGTCKILDFGISKRLLDIYANNAEMLMQGTIFWMAPEVIDLIVEDKKQGYSAKIDVWLLGCVVLEMFAGKRPWLNEAVVLAIYKIGKTKLAPPILEDIKMLQQARDFILKCFTINPEKRPTAKELLDHDFMKESLEFNFGDTKLAQVIEFKRKNGNKNGIKRS